MDLLDIPCKIYSCSKPEDKIRQTPTLTVQQVFDQKQEKQSLRVVINEQFIEKRNTRPYLRHILISALQCYLLLLCNSPYSISKAYSQNV